jgi:3-hydroxyisobutyrate dehydrogenase-like beta-hydroxyacid dehydrogenase
MPVKTVALLHPGEMGSAIGACLVRRGLRVVWASAERSAETRSRAIASGLQDVGSLERALDAADLVLSVCPPHGALALAREVAGHGFEGVFVDANAIAPETARSVGRAVQKAGASFVDGGIIGPPPVESGRTRLYLSGGPARDVAALFSGTNMEAIALDAPAGAASALKACYAGWTKGATALLAAIRALAESEGVAAPLLAEWRLSQPGLDKRSEAVTVQARKAWRWIGEMEEIAASFEAVGLPGGFHLASADLYRKLEGFKGGDAPPALSAITAAIRRAPKRKSPAAAARRRSAPKAAPPAKFKFGTGAAKRVEAKRGQREPQEPTKQKFKFGKQTA